jgi:hypothetical protein
MPGERILLAVTATIAALLTPVSGAGAAPVLLDSFTDPGCGGLDRTYTVPNGIDTIAVEAVGAAGAGNGGRGDGVSQVLDGVSGAELFACVAVGGGSPGGGGASGVALGSDFGVPLVVAGGGGASNGTPHSPGDGVGGDAGHPAGLSGGLGWGATAFVGSGGGGNTAASTPGAGGTNSGLALACSGANGAGQPGTGWSASGPGSGGNGGADGSCDAGGGGGAGYYGGGGGAQGPFPGGGGGGSSFCKTDALPVGTASGCTFNHRAGTSTAAGGGAGQAHVLVGEPVAPAVSTGGDPPPFLVGTAGSFSIETETDTFPTPVLTKSGALPIGVTFVDDADGTATLTGTPEAGTGGTYPFSVTAANGVGPGASTDYDLTVNEAPELTSAATGRMEVATPTSIPITTSHAFPADVEISRTGALPRGPRGPR